MMKEVIATGNSLAEAQQAASKKLGCESEKIKFEVLDLPEKKVLGIFGGRLAKVRAYVEVKDDECCKTTNNNEEQIEASNDEENSKERKLSPREKLLNEYEKNKEDAAKMAVEFLNYVIKNIYQGECKLEISYKLITKGIDINIKGDELKSVIGYRGEVLEALQYITNLYIKNAFNGKCNRVFLNIDDYREKREKTLVYLAQKKAAKAKQMQRQVSVEPMSAYDRRIIHSAIQSISGVTSWSEGDGIYRHVVIAPSDRDRKNTMGKYSYVNPAIKANEKNSFDQIEIKDNFDNNTKDEAPDAPLYGKIDL